MQAGNRRGVSHAGNVREMRRQEMKITAGVEKSCAHLVVAWRRHPPRKGGCAAASNRQGLNRLPGDAFSRLVTLRHEVDCTGEE